MSKSTVVILIILSIGFLQKLIFTSDGNFLFNIDNARDLVDVREMVVLKELRLTGPTSAIEGLFNGPAWYYLLAIPFIISDGDPYSTIVLQFVLWAIGGFFLLKIISNWSRILIIPVGFLWIASDYISLTTFYAFNPNPVTQLTPLFIYLLHKYLETKKIFYIAYTFFLGGLFFNFEMNFGIFIPLTILFSIILSGKTNLLKSKTFWVGSLFFVLFLLPQLLFELRNKLFMTNSVLNFLLNSEKKGYNFFSRLQTLTLSFFNVFVPTLMNHKTFSTIILLFFIPVIVKFVKEKNRDVIVICALTYIFIPFLFYLFLPVTVNPWHLGGVAAASIILVGFLLKKLLEMGVRGKIIALIISVVIVYFSLQNILFALMVEKSKNMDPSVFVNEIAAIDYVYKRAEGKNFKVYIYLPSVYDYPYQYLFWWYGKKVYGYIPGEYAYSPNKPQYISQKEKFEGSKENYAGLVFLIKEPDRIGYREAWENDFKNMDFISKEMIGPIEIEIRKE